MCKFLNYVMDSNYRDSIFNVLGKKEMTFEEIMNYDAKMNFFGSHSVPMWYKSGTLNEYWNTLKNVSITNTSHLIEYFISGKEASDLIQKLTCNDVYRLSPIGKKDNKKNVEITALMTEKGTFFDAALLYQLKSKTYLIIGNSGKEKKYEKYFENYAKDFNVVVENKSKDYKSFTLVGPKSIHLLDSLFNIDVMNMRRFEAAFGEINGKKMLLSKTGYTGLTNFECFIDCNDVNAPESILKDILEHGKKYNICRGGFALRDILRTSAGLVLNEASKKYTPLEVGWKKFVKFKDVYRKEIDFLGRDYLIKQKENGIDIKMTGFIVDKGMVKIGDRILVDGEEISVRDEKVHVTSAVYSPSLKRCIGFTILPIEYTDLGRKIQIESFNKKGEVRKTIDAEIVKIPFMKKEDYKKLIKT